jgi:hypothetical protein
VNVKIWKSENCLTETLTEEGEFSMESDCEISEAGDKGLLSCDQIHFSGYFVIFRSLIAGTLIPLIQELLQLIARPSI